MKACEQEAPGESVQYKNLFTEVRITEQNSMLCDLEGVSSKLTHTFYTPKENWHEAPEEDLGCLRPIMYN